MTGEMTKVDSQEWPIQAAIARSVKGKLQPFDVYQGPYVSVGADIRAGSGAYAMPLQGLGLVRLWVTSDDGATARVYREDTDTLSAPFYYRNTRAACREARKLLTMEVN